MIHTLFSSKQSHFPLFKIMPWLWGGSIIGYLITILLNTLQQQSFSITALFEQPTIIASAFIVIGVSVIWVLMIWNDTSTALSIHLILHDNITLLSNIVNSDQPYKIRLDALQALGNYNNREGLAALVQFGASEDEGLRRAALQSLIWNIARENIDTETGLRLIQENDELFTILVDQVANISSKRVRKTATPKHPYLEIRFSGNPESLLPKVQLTVEQFVASHGLSHEHG